MKNSGNETTPLTYAAAGVDINAGNHAVKLIKDSMRAGFRPEVVGEIGGFAAAFRLANLEHYTDPVLVTGCDGVGTKLKIAFETGVKHTIGQDLVAMCVNDILVNGAEPLFFLDYFATAKVLPEEVAKVVGGIATACLEAGCALIGGETAEMPGFYQDGEFDLAGFVVGIVDYAKIIDGKNITPGDLIIGLPSSGLHSNGFSMVREIVARSDLKTSDIAPWENGITVGEALLVATRIYVKSILQLITKLPIGTIKGMIHITGGGFIENIPRILPKGCSAKIVCDSWQPPPIFTWLQKQGNITTDEMFRTFNNGIGFMLVISKNDAQMVRSALKELQEESYIIGEIEYGEGVNIV